MNGEKNPSEGSLPAGSGQQPNYVEESNQTSSKRFLVGFILITLILGGSSWTARYFWLNQKLLPKILIFNIQGKIFQIIF